MYDATWSVRMSISFSVSCARAMSRAKPGDDRQRNTKGKDGHPHGRASPILSLALASKNSFKK